MSDSHQLWENYRLLLDLLYHDVVNPEEGEELVWSYDDLDIATTADWRGTGMSVRVAHLNNDRFAVNITIGRRGTGRAVWYHADLLPDDMQQQVARIWTQVVNAQCPDIRDLIAETMAGALRRGREE